MPGSIPASGAWDEASNGENGEIKPRLAMFSPTRTSNANPKYHQISGLFTAGAWREIFFGEEHLRLVSVQYGYEIAPRPRFAYHHSDHWHLWPMPRLDRAHARIQ